MEFECPCGLYKELCTVKSGYHKTHRNVDIMPHWWTVKIGKFPFQNSFISLWAAASIESKKGWDGYD